MKISEGFVLRELLGEYVITAEGPAQVNFNKMISLNASAAYLWKAVEGKDFTVGDLTNLLLDQYEVSEDVAAADAAKIADKWHEIGLVTD